MNAPTVPAALTKPAFDIHLLASFAPSLTRTQARRRAKFTKEELAELAANVKVVGVMQPIVARPHPKPSGPIKYEIIAGERRWLASTIAGTVEIPAIIRDVTDADIITLQLTENLQRKDPDQLEEAEGYNELRQARKINADQVADLLGVSRSTVFNRLKLLDLCTEARAALDSGKLTPSVALLISRLPDPQMQAKATAGCLGKGRFFARGATPTHEEAEKYIREEFLVRIDGSAAISRAKAEGKPTIGGKDAEAIWKARYNPPAGYIILTDTYWQDNKRKTFAATLGENPPGVVLIQSPHTGAAVKCLPRADVVKLFKEKKVKLPPDLEPRQSSSAPMKTAKALSPAAAEKAKAERDKELAKRRREAMKEELDIDIRFAVFKAVRMKSPSKLGKPELLQTIALFDDLCARLDPSICPRPKSLTSAPEKDLVRVIIDQLYGNEIEDNFYDEKPLFAAAKRYGVNVDKIRKDLTAKAEEELKEATATAEKKAGKK